MSVYKSYYDETLFTTGSSLKKYNNIFVNNKVDAYLLSKLNIKFTTSRDDDILYKLPNINPPSTNVKGLVIYTLPNSDTVPYLNMMTLVDFNQIVVDYTPSGKVIPLVIGDLPVSAAGASTLADKTVTFTYNSDNSLSDYEQALLVKYYSINTNITITIDLYQHIFKYFKADKRCWFRLDPNYITQTDNLELIDENSGRLLIPQDVLMGYSSPSMDFTQQWN